MYGLPTHLPPRQATLSGPRPPRLGQGGRPAASRWPGHGPAWALSRRPGATLSGWLVLAGLLAALLAWPAQSAHGQGIELRTLELHKTEAELTLEYSARLTLSPAVDEALQRGVPMYFVAQATLWRSRWYWRDERVAQVRRTWRVAYQPLTNGWRVSLGSLSQPYPSLVEALASISRVSGWQVAESAKLAPGERHYVEFSLRLDNKQLPLPMQIDVGSDYQLGVERTLRVD